MNTTRTADPFRAALTRSVAMLVTACLLWASGCGPGPLEQRSEESLHRSLVNSLQRQIAQAEQHPTTQTASKGEDRSGDLQIKPEYLEQIQKEYSVDGYLQEFKATAEAGDTGEKPDSYFDDIFGTDLYGQTQKAIGVGLERVIANALRYNLDVQVARFGPAISEAQVVAAEAAFDWSFSTGVTWQDHDTPQVGPGFLALGAVRASDQSVGWTAGLDRQLETGGSIGVSQALTYTDQRSSAFGSVGSPNPASDVAYTLDYTQPLLRGFGSDSALAEVRLNRNAERKQISALRSTLITTLTSVEDAYWDLVTAYRGLIIQNKLLERGVKTRDDIIARRAQDARQAQVADAIARVERRRGDLIQAQTTLRRASDRLKSLINDPAIPVGSELLLIPVDKPLDQPVEFSLADSLTTAAERRPELEAALLDIDDSSIRQQLARNARRPRLDLQAQLQMLSLQGNAGDAYDKNFDGEFIDSFLFGVQFEQPLGNRAGEAVYRQRRLERMRSVVAYRNTLQGIVLDVKGALDDLVTNAKLIEQARLSRIAQGEALRTLQVEKRLTDAGYTVERLNLELNQQESLASAERAETAALINYNRSMAALHAATGTTLERNRIDFVVPDANQLEPGQSPLDYHPEPNAGDENGNGPDTARPDAASPGAARPDTADDETPSP